MLPLWPLRYCNISMHLAPLHPSLCYPALCNTLVPLALLQPACFALSWDSLHCISLCRSIRICLYPISQFLLLHIGAPPPAPPPWENHFISLHLLPGGMAACDPSSHLAWSFPLLEVSTWVDVSTWSPLSFLCCGCSTTSWSCCTNCGSSTIIWDFF